VLTWSSSTTSGCKMIKRQMYGRAKPDLRKRVLLADAHDRDN
jgi:transposase